MAKKRVKKVERILYYYELEFLFNDEFDPGINNIRGFFEAIKGIAKSKAKYRYQNFKERIVTINSITLSKDKDIIIGKLRCIRKDLLPEMMNTETDIAKGIIAAENEGLVETTHFRIDFGKKKPILCIEHNQFGSKIGDFLLYLERIGTRKKITTEILYVPLVKNELKKFKARMGEFSKFSVKVHRNYLDKIKSIDTGLWTALNKAIDHYQSEYAILTLKFDWDIPDPKSKIKTTVHNLLDKLSSKKSNAMFFNSLKVDAQDSDKNNRIETFDLLVDKVKSEIKVEKREKYRTVISLDMYQKMELEMDKKLAHIK